MSTALTSVLADFDGVPVQTGRPDDLRLAPDDGDRRVVLVLDEQVQWHAGGLCKKNPHTELSFSPTDIWHKWPQKPITNQCKGSREETVQFFSRGFNGKGK